ncbi:hypothetical protein [Gloeothece verrucosa]|uniref:Uncharacterized protein n=1 Tax=Gloeothece verrucosa (strain PCC 7822) TaxID=497965 RepID=E0UMX1_GLOV7|nr:hypothetical protein [Gloeothece verrucosa]ADN18301.1 conserved hypothetical protein [Gloeothece verrucosa PCC 7822]
MSNKPRQRPLSFIAPIKGGMDEDSVQKNYKELSALIADVSPAGLNDVGTVHFGNFLFLEPATGSDGTQYYKKFALFTFYDGSFERYVKDFAAKVGDTFNALLQHLDDVPKDLRDVKKQPEKFSKYVQAHDQPVAKWYTAYPDKIVKEITNPVQGVVADFEEAVL